MKAQVKITVERTERTCKITYTLLPEGLEATETFSDGQKHRWPDAGETMHELARCTNFWRVEHPDGGDQIQFPAPDRPENVYWPNEPAKEITWSDRIGSRGRQSILLLYTRNNVYMYKGGAIPGVCVTLTSDYTKDGKWSHTVFTIALAEGVRHSALTQDWESGEYVNDHTALPIIAKQLGLVGASNSLTEDALKRIFVEDWTEWKAKTSALSALEEVAEATGQEVVEITYNCSKITNRAGRNMLLVDGEVWDFEATDKVTIIEKTGKNEYRLAIVGEVAELQEYSAYGNDSVEGMGFVKNDDGKWVRNQQPNSDSPFAALLRK
jgi:hypothetical protein